MTKAQDGGGNLFEFREVNAIAQPLQLSVVKLIGIFIGHH